MPESRLPLAPLPWGRQALFLLALALTLPALEALAVPRPEPAQWESGSAALSPDALSAACGALVAAARQDDASHAQVLGLLEPLVREVAALRAVSGSTLQAALASLPGLLAAAEGRLPPPPEAGLAPLHHAVGPFLLSRAEARVILGDRTGRRRSAVAEQLRALLPSGAPDLDSRELIALVPVLARVAEGPWLPPADATAMARVALSLAPEGGPR